MVRDWRKTSAFKTLCAHSRWRKCSNSIKRNNTRAILSRYFRWNSKRMIKTVQSTNNWLKKRSRTWTCTRRKNCRINKLTSRSSFRKTRLWSWDKISIKNWWWVLPCIRIFRLTKSLITELRNSKEFKS